MELKTYQFFQCGGGAPQKIVGKSQLKLDLAGSIMNIGYDTVLGKR